jgi:nitrite reductase/ring-hydroxylating ferredoxin subunit
MTVLCRLDEIANPGAKGFAFGEGAARVEIFVVRRGAEIFGYTNRCPHADTPLDWHSGEFLDLTKTFLQCGTHGALFEIAGGLCVAGPCKGRRLAPIGVEITENGLECPAVEWIR